MFSNATSLVVYRELDAAVRAFLDHQDAFASIAFVSRSPAIGALGWFRCGSKDLQRLDLRFGQLYAQIYEMTATPLERVAQLERALAQIESSDPERYAPFTVREFDAVSLDTSVLSLCLNWPQAPAQINATRPVPEGTQYPDVPVLVLSGEFDPLTPWPQGSNAAKLFSNAKYVVIQNTTHVTALSDEDNCASTLVRNFLTNLDPGDMSCASKVAEVFTVPSFVAQVADLEPATALAGNEGTQDDLRFAAVATQTVGDALARWWVNDNGKGVGFRGGRFTYKTLGSHSLYKFKKLRWTEDVAISGSADWDYNFPGAVSARVKLAGPDHEQGNFTLTWSSRIAGSQVRISGRIGRRNIHASTYAPF
jgi:hypothetical protein